MRINPVISIYEINGKKKQIRKDRTWKDFLFWLGNAPYYYDHKELLNYDPEKWRDAFEKIGRPI
jgi:hypothetical protein